MYSITFDLPKKHLNFLKINFINSKCFFIYETQEIKKYLIIPNNFIFKKINNSKILFSIWHKKNKALLHSFLMLFNRFLKSTKKEYIRKIILRGLGFKISLLSNGSILQFKAGYSHLIQLKIPDKIIVLVKKNALYLKAQDLIFLGNFCKKIKSLKAPNAYTGKGFWYKQEKKLLKAFKKK